MEFAHLNGKLVKLNGAKNLYLYIFKLPSRGGEWVQTNLPGEVWYFADGVLDTGCEPCDLRYCARGGDIMLRPLLRELLGEPR